MSRRIGETQSEADGRLVELAMAAAAAMACRRVGISAWRAVVASTCAGRGVRAKAKQITFTGCWEVLSSRRATSLRQKVLLVD